MELTIKRRPSKEATTLGELFIDGVFFCYTLEDEVREDPNPTTPENEAKVYGKTAIPAGRYEIDITFSQKFGKLMILVKNVPGYTGIRIHSGNDAEDTLGCPLVGETIDGPTRIHGGSVVMPKLFTAVNNALIEGQEVFLTVLPAPAPTAPAAQSVTV